MLSFCLSFFPSFVQRTLSAFSVVRSCPNLVFICDDSAVTVLAALGQEGAFAEAGETEEKPVALRVRNPVKLGKLGCLQIGYVLPLELIKYLDQKCL